MTLPAMHASQISQINEAAILYAPPARLLTMLYDRLVLDLERAKQAQERSDWPVAHTSLLHAQDIVRELSRSLREDVWDGAKDLKAIYNYVLTALINANVHRSIESTEECLTLIQPIGEAWRQAADSLPSQPTLAGVGGSLGIG